jgi:uncharacterized protein (DUF58 family)
MADPVAARENGAYCDLQGLIRLRFGARDLTLGRQKKAFSLLVGPHRTKFRGRGIECDEVRAYQAGDDSRNIDWRVTARTGTPHTKLFREERERPVFLLVDQSLSMFFGSRRCFKSVVAANAAALLAWAALQNNDRVGGLVFGDTGHSEIRPKRSVRNVLRLLHRIYAFNRQLRQGQPGDGGGVSRALEELRRIVRPGSNIFIISDFRRLREDGEKHLYQLSRHNDICALLVWDPLEETLPLPGLYTVTDGERRAVIHTGDRAMRLHYEQNFQEKTRLLAHMLADMGIPLLRLSTQDSPHLAFKHLFGGRK